jgi:signal transduction histidine kinase
VPIVNRPGLPLPPLIAALRDLAPSRADPAATRAAEEALAAVAASTGLAGIRLELVDADPLPAVTLALGTLAGGPAGQEFQVGSAGDEQIGAMWVDGPEAGQEAAASAVISAVQAARAHLRAERAESHLAALDQALHGIAGAAASGSVLQLIVDRVRDLAHAKYAALGIVGPNGRIAQFLTSGLDAETRRRIGNLPEGHGLLGALIREGETIRIPDIAADPRRHGFPPNHPPMRSFLGVPITVKGKSVGNLYLTDKQGQPEFSGADQELVERFALHAGIAFENARLVEEVQQLRLIEERERIGADLHDGVIQRIYGANLFLEDVAELIATRPDEAGRRVEEVIGSLNRTIEEIRAFIFVLRAPGEEVGVGPTLRALAAEVRLHSGLEVEVTVDEADPPAADRMRELLSVAREALSNAARHAGATGAWLRLAREGDGWRLEVRDDGRGFDPDADRPAEHQGLDNMRRRAERLGGTLQVESRPGGGGTRIILLLPPEGQGANRRSRRGA